MAQRLMTFFAKLKQQQKYTEFEEYMNRHRQKVYLLVCDSCRVVYQTSKSWNARKYNHTYCPGCNWGTVYTVCKKDK